MNVLELLPPVNPAAPCGPDPETGTALVAEWDNFGVQRDAHYQAWSEYRRAQQELPDQRPPDWSGLQKTIAELAKQTKHLRLAVALTETLAHTQGLRGLRDGLFLITNWCATWWPGLHPGATDAEDVSLRGEIIEALNNERTLRRLEGMPLAEAGETRGVRRVVTAGPFTLHDFQEASKADPANPEHAQLVLRTFAQGDPVLKETNFCAACQAREAAAVLMNLFMEKGQQLALGKLIEHIDRLLPLLRASAAFPTPAVDSEDGSPGVDATLAAGGAQGINSRETASAALTRVSSWFRKMEPSCPVPYFLERAQRCIGRDYLEIADEILENRSEVDRVLRPRP